MVALMGVGLAMIPFGCLCSLLIFGFVCTTCEMACFVGFAGLTPRFSRLPMEAGENADLLCLSLGPDRGTLLRRDFAKDWILRPYLSKVLPQGKLHTMLRLLRLRRPTPLESDTEAACPWAPGAAHRATA